MDLLLHVGLSNAVVATILAVTAALAGWVGRRPALTHALWLLVLIKLITPPLYPVSVSWFPSSPPMPMPVAVPETRVAEVPPLAEANGAFEELSQPEAEGALPLDDRIESAAPETRGSAAPDGELAPRFSWKEAALAVWLVGAAAWFTLASMRLCRFQRLLGFARPAGAELQERVRCLAARLGLMQRPKLWLIPGRVSPLLWALTGEASLILPCELLCRLSGDQLDALLTHELAHLRRRDHWVRVLEFVTIGLFWWHPVVWWARREIREAEEQCCDAWVVWALPERVRGYALALVETVDFLSEARPVLPPATSGIGYVHDLRRRMTMIMRGTTPRALTWSGGLVVLGAALFMLPILPTLAQDSPPGRSSSEDEFKRAEAEMRQAAARLEQAKAQLGQAQRTRAAGERAANADVGQNLVARNEICLRCHADAHAAPKPKDEVGELHGAVIRLSEEAQKQQVMLRETQAKLESVMRRLEEQTRPKGERGQRQPEVERPGQGSDSGTPPGGGGPDRGPQPQQAPGTGPGYPGGKGEGADSPQRPQRPGAGPHFPGSGGGPMRPDPEIRGDDPRRPQPDRHDLERQNQDRIQELTNQMERVLKEMEKLRQEIRERSNIKPGKEEGNPRGGSDSERGTNKLSKP